jgi:uncharacterized membrane protein
MGHGDKEAKIRHYPPDNKNIKHRLMGHIRGDKPLISRVKKQAALQDNQVRRLAAYSTAFHSNWYSVKH